MFLLLFVGLGLAGVSAALVLRLLMLNRTQAARTLSQIAGYGFKGAGSQSARPSVSLSKRVDGLAGSVGEFLAHRMQSVREDELRAHLQAAGIYRLSARKFMGYRLLLTLFLPALWLWLMLAGGS